MHCVCDVGSCIGSKSEVQPVLHTPSGKGERSSFIDAKSVGEDCPKFNANNGELKVIFERTNPPTNEIKGCGSLIQRDPDTGRMMNVTRQQISNDVI